MVRRVKAYLNKMKVVVDEDKLHALSLECEGSGSGSGLGPTPGSVPIRKRHPSPTLSTTSSTSSTSEGRKNRAPKFGEFEMYFSVSVLFFAHFALAGKLGGHSGIYLWFPPNEVSI